MTASNSQSPGSYLLAETADLSAYALNSTIENQSAGRRDVVLVPDGRSASRNGEFILDARSAELIIADFEGHGVDLVIDYEHQTLGGELASPDGKALAAGWVKALRYQPGRGIVGSVDWTDQARQAIRAGQYRYLSPVVIVRNSDHKAVQLHSVALTNLPAIPNMQPLAASARAGGLKASMESLIMAQHPTTGPATSPAPGGGGSGENAQLPEAVAAKAAEAIEQIGFLLDVDPAKGLAALQDALTELYEAAFPDQTTQANQSDLTDADLIGLLKRLRAALGLPEDATTEQLAKALADLDEIDTASVAGDAQANKALLRSKARLKLYQDRDRAELIELAYTSMRVPNGFQKHFEALPLEAMKSYLESVPENHYASTICYPDGSTAQFNSFGIGKGFIPGIYPPQGKTVPPRHSLSLRDQTTIIAMSQREYRDSPELQKLTSARAYANMKLRDAGLAPLVKPGDKEELVY